MNSYITVIIHIILLLFVLQKYEMCGTYNTDEGQMYRSFVKISRGKEIRGWKESVVKEFVKNWRQVARKWFISVDILLIR
jgi:hypothetical protein